MANEGDIGTNHAPSAGSTCSPTCYHCVTSALGNDIYVDLPEEEDVIRVAGAVCPSMVLL